jgi:hypothetical protein
MPSLNLRYRFPAWNDDSNPTDQQLARLWRAAGWHRVGNKWVPTRPEQAAGRVVVQAALPNLFPDIWSVWLDGAICLEADGRLHGWHDLEGAAHDALRLVEHDWHGPSYRFQTTLPWQQRDGFSMRPLLSSGIAVWGHVIPFDETPVAVVREWQFPYDGRGWGVFIGSAQRHALQTLGLIMHFRSADDARRAADLAVARWVKSQEWDTLNGRRWQPQAAS